MDLNFGLKIHRDDYSKRVKKATRLALKQIVIALAGPLTNVICIIILVLLKTHFTELQYQYAIYTNILLIIFNLFPIYPLDGGRIMKEIIHIFAGIRKSYEYTNIITKINVYILTAVSSILILYYKNIAILWVVIYLWAIALKGAKEFKIKSEIYKLSSRRVAYNLLLHKPMHLK